MSERLTEEQIQEIEARAEAAERAWLAMVQYRVPAEIRHEVTGN